MSSPWVLDSVKTQIKTGEADDYGYGWWITGSNEYAAIGRGGQRIQAYPAANAMLVMTSGGEEYDHAVALLTPALADVGKPRPANPGGIQQLNAALIQISKAPTAQPVARLPATARAISGGGTLVAARTVLASPNIKWVVDTGEADRRSVSNHRKSRVAFDLMETSVALSGCLVVADKQQMLNEC